MQSEKTITNIETRCPFCLGETFEKIIDRPGFPVTPNALEKGVLLDDDGQSFRFDFQIGICTECGLIQHLSPPDPEVLYAFLKNEVVGGKWTRHFDLYSDFILTEYQTGTAALEVGCGNLGLANMLINGGVEKITAVDFNTNENNITDGINFLKGDFEALEIDGLYDIVYSCHVFEHLENPNDHILKAKSLLSEGGKCIVSLPEFKYYIENQYLNAFNQEHPIYPFEEQVITIFKSHGFELQKSYNFENHSLFFCFQLVDKSKDDSYSNTGGSGESINEKVDILKTYKERLDKINDYLLSIDRSKEVFLFGANSSTQTLLGLEWTKHYTIRGALDNASMKLGKYLYGSDLQVFSPAILQECDPSKVAVIVFSGAFEQEMIAQVQDFSADIAVFDSAKFLASLGDDKADN